MGTKRQAVDSNVSSQAVDAAREAGLHYVSDLSAGIRRLPRGASFRYETAEGLAVRDRSELERFRSLVIPPAWTDVRICASARGHIQAIGRDARGRMQYRYHPRWRETRDATKFDQLAAFARTLPAIRRRVSHDLRLPGLPRAKVLATVVRLLETTRMRIGNEEYARQNGSFGLSTLRDHHVTIAGSRMAFRFRGKSGRRHEVEVTDRRLAAIVSACQDIPGHELFRYLDEAGTAQSIDSGAVNEYLREISGTDTTARLFRTWAGTVLALGALRAMKPESDRERRASLVEAVRTVAAELGNTPAVCRRCYIHPAVMESFLRGDLDRALDQCGTPRSPAGLDPDERRALAFLVADKRRRAAGSGSRRRRALNGDGDVRGPSPSPSPRPRGSRTAT
ncbi:MAG TPA: DNA topoisomerase IB [Candidatus Udaeobacter sp.]|jgi:DNA topoisomerase-1|nr:DNA topoisomerase IB [Candidatus Udaeobacter sp.]